MTPVARHAFRPLALLAAGLLFGCASSPGGAAADGDPATATTTDDRATATSACAGDCSLRVENRLDVDVEVSTERQSALPDLGVVRADRTETFELPDFQGEQLEVWVRAEKSQEFLHLTCVRQFPRGTGRLILGSQISGGGC